MKHYKKQLQAMTSDEIIHEINVVANSLDSPQSESGRKEGTAIYLTAVQEFNRRTETPKDLGCRKLKINLKGEC